MSAGQGAGQVRILHPFPRVGCSSDGAAAYGHSLAPLCPAGPEVPEPSCTPGKLPELSPPLLQVLSPDLPHPTHLPSVLWGPAISTHKSVLIDGQFTHTCMWLLLSPPALLSSCRDEPTAIPMQALPAAPPQCGWKHPTPWGLWLSGMPTLVSPWPHSVAQPAAQNH